MVLDADRRSPATGPDDSAADPTAGRLSAEPEAGLTSSLFAEVIAWAFAERNAAGDWVLRDELRARLDTGPGHVPPDGSGAASLLYLGYRCQACWESALSLEAYGTHLCGANGRAAGIPGGGSHP
ncbi:MAG TPA: hypothetical protein VKG43_14720 [Acidimicrobiales bacterium]|nr:hypothetical protein [Acidimicrobiales bacterium]